MENNITINMNNLTDSEKEQLFILLDKGSIKKENTLWKPEKDDTYYLTNIIPCQSYWKNTFEENMYYEIGMVHRTRDEATEDCKRRECLTLWKRLSDSSGENNNKWNGNRSHYFIVYDHIKKTIDIDVRRSIEYEGTYFATKESLEKAIKLIGIEDIKKYILGIKEDNSK